MFLIYDIPLSSVIYIWDAVLKKWNIIVQISIVFHSKWRNGKKRFEPPSHKENRFENCRVPFTVIKPLSSQKVS